MSIQNDQVLTTVCPVALESRMRNHNAKGPKLRCPTMISITILIAVLVTAPGNLAMSNIMPLLFRNANGPCDQKRARNQDSPCEVNTIQEEPQLRSIVKPIGQLLLSFLSMTVDQKQRLLSMYHQEDCEESVDLAKNLAYCTSPKAYGRQIVDSKRTGMLMMECAHAVAAALALIESSSVLEQITARRDSNFGGPSDQLSMHSPQRLGSQFVRRSCAAISRRGQRPYSADLVCRARSRG